MGTQGVLLPIYLISIKLHGNNESSLLEAREQTKYVSCEGCVRYERLSEAKSMNFAQI